MQSPLCKKLFSFTCKKEFTLWRTLKFFLPPFPSCLLLKISLFYDTWIPTFVPKIEISYTFWPITHNLFGPKCIALVTGNPLNFEVINEIGCCPFLSVKTCPSPFSDHKCPESLLAMLKESTKFIWTPNDLNSFFGMLHLFKLFGSMLFYLTRFKKDNLPLKYSL